MIGKTAMLRDQQRALEAYKRIKKRKDSGKLDPSYSTQATSLMPLIRSAGLLQACEFLYTRKDSSAQDLLTDLASTVLSKETKAKEFLEQIRNAEFERYLYLSRESLAVCKWYRRYAESMVQAKPKDTKSATLENNTHTNMSKDNEVPNNVDS